MTNKANSNLKPKSIGVDGDIYWFKFLPLSDAELSREVVFTEVAVSSGGIVFIPATMLCASVFVMQAIKDDDEMYLDAEDGYYVPVEWARLKFPVLAPVFDSVDRLMVDHVRDIVSNRKPAPDVTLH
jgi:hypothetical protein